jgi:ribonuclease Z
VKVTLLGTGIPAPDLLRRGASQVVEVGDDLVMVDCGRGALDRFVEAGYVRPDGRVLERPLHTLALTHLHSDHITGIPDLLWAGWVMRWWERPPRLIGPPGTADFLRYLMQAFSYDIRVRSGNEAFTTASLIPEVVEVDEGSSFDLSNWRLTAFRVEHEPVDEAFGYRIDADSGSVAISGDTRYSENLVRHAQNVDLLIHEVYSKAGMARRRENAQTPRARAVVDAIAGYHTPADDAGKVAAHAHAKQLVLSHVLLGAGGSPEDILHDVGSTYAGPAAVSSDLQRFSTA